MPVNDDFDAMLRAWIESPLNDHYLAGHSDGVGDERKRLLVSLQEFVALEIDQLTDYHATADQWLEDFVVWHLNDGVHPKHGAERDTLLSKDRGQLG